MRAVTIGLTDGDSRDEVLQLIEKRQRDLLQFFEQVPLLVTKLQNAEEECRRLGKIFGRSRKKGAPGDHARDWALVRLMWVWRDALGHELTIYLPRVRDQVELDAPEPEGCMAFVVNAMRHMDPVEPHQLSALECKLIDLRPLVPTERLAVARSRGN